MVRTRRRQIHEALEEGMLELSEREHQVMLLHYGWVGGPVLATGSSAQIGEVKQFS